MSASVVAMLVGTAGYASADGEDFVRGSGTTPINSFDFDAVKASGDSDDDAEGDFSCHAASVGEALFSPRGSVVSMTIEGNRAGLLVRTEEGSHPGGEDQYMLVSVVDGGPGGTDYFGTTPPAPEGVYPDSSPGPAPFPVDSGDIVVHED